jgi:hypothetical protein
MERLWKVAGEAPFALDALAIASIGTLAAPMATLVAMVL